MKIKKILWVLILILSLVLTVSSASADLKYDNLKMEDVSFEYNGTHILFNNSILTLSLTYGEFISPIELLNVTNFTEIPEITKYNIKDTIKNNIKDTDFIKSIKYTIKSNRGHIAPPELEGKTIKTDLKLKFRKDNKNDILLTTKNKTNINITVKNYNGKILINYTYYDNNVFLKEYTNIINAKTSKKVPFEATTEPMENGKAKQIITYDNLYNEEKSELLYLIYDDTATLKRVDFNGAKNSISNEPYINAIYELEAAGIDKSMILNNLVNKKIKVYNVTIPENVKLNISAEWTYEWKEESETSLIFKQPPVFYSYIIGSGGALVYNETIEICGDVNNNSYSEIIVPAGITLNVCSTSGIANFTVNDYVNSRVVINGTINAYYKGNSGGGRRTCGDNAFSDGTSGTGDSKGLRGDTFSGPYSSGGGGAGHGGAGGAGGNTNTVSYIGGAGGPEKGSNTNTDYLLGDGGGSGACIVEGSGGATSGKGGDGGGAVYIKSPYVEIHGKINVSGEPAESYQLCSAGASTELAVGGSGGGSGGSIVVIGNIVDINGSNLYAKGGNGGAGCSASDGVTACAAGGGGGGAGGRIKVFYEVSLNDSNIATNISGGSSGAKYEEDGGSSNNGLAGSVGSYTTNNTANMDVLNYTLTNPTLNTVTIVPSSPSINDNLQGYCNGSNNVSATIDLYYKWWNGSNLYSSGSSSSIASNTNKNVNNVSNTLTSMGEVWTLSCLVNYASENSTWTNSSSVTIQNLYINTNETRLASSNTIQSPTLGNTIYISSNVTHTTDNASILWVNFTIIKGEEYWINNVNGTADTSNTIWNSSNFLVNETGVYTVTMKANDNDSTVTETFQFTVTDTLTNSFNQTTKNMSGLQTKYIYLNFSHDSSENFTFEPYHSFNTSIFTITFNETSFNQTNSTDRHILVTIENILYDVNTNHSGVIGINRTNTTYPKEENTSITIQLEDSETPTYSSGTPTTATTGTQFTFTITLTDINNITSATISVDDPDSINILDDSALTYLSATRAGSGLYTIKYTRTLTTLKNGTYQVTNVTAIDSKGYKLTEVNPFTVASSSGGDGAGGGGGGGSTTVINQTITETITDNIGFLKPIEDFKLDENPVLVFFLIIAVVGIVATILKVEKGSLFIFDQKLVRLPKWLKK